MRSHRTAPYNFTLGNPSWHNQARQQRRFPPLEGGIALRRNHFSSHMQHPLVHGHPSDTSPAHPVTAFSFVAIYNHWWKGRQECSRRCRGIWIHIPANDQGRAHGAGGHHRCDERNCENHELSEFRSPLLAINDVYPIPLLQPERTSPASSRGASGCCVRHCR